MLSSFTSVKVFCVDFHMYISDAGGRVHHWRALYQNEQRTRGNHSCHHCLCSLVSAAPPGGGQEGPRPPWYICCWPLPPIHSHPLPGDKTQQQPNKTALKRMSRDKAEIWVGFCWKKKKLKVLTVLFLSLLSNIFLYKNMQQQSNKAVYNTGDCCGIFKLELACSEYMFTSLH